MKTVVVIPTIRDLEFLDYWKNEFNNDVYVIVCEDKEKITLSLPKGLNGTIYSHKEIKKELGKNDWIFPNHTASIRGFGYFKAWQLKPDMIFTVDDDCYPIESDFLKSHWVNLNRKATLDWVTTGTLYTRGFPYNIREKNEVVISHGTWRENPDFDAPTQLLEKRPFYTMNRFIPRNNFYPMSGMNLAFKPKITPLLYFGLQGPDYPFQRFDDIWAGIFSKKILDHFNLAVFSGEPEVRHSKKSNVYDNLIKEATGIKVNEYLWEKVNEITLTSNDFSSCYIELLEKLDLDDNYWDKYSDAIYTWTNLFT